LAIIKNINTNKCWWKSILVYHYGKQDGGSLKN
jgi:hypothetical protein